VKPVSAMLLTPWLHQCKMRPKAVALAEGGTVITYETLLAQAQAVAAALQDLGVQPGQRVAIHLERGVAAVTAVFGALLAGACYVPLDVKNPHERRAFIVNDAGVAAILGSGNPPQGWEESPWLDIARCPMARPSSATRHKSDLAVILYTSGSTGHPKGVALSHGAVAAFAAWAADRVTLCPNDRIASSAPFFFDLSTFDLYAALGRGASLHFVPSQWFMSPARLGAWLQSQKISGWYTVPSLLSFLAYKGNLSDTLPATLRFLLFAGEVFPTPDLLRLASALPHTALYNLFGPTETNVCCYWPVERSRLNPRLTIPIGLPACGAELKIDAGSGELWVRSPALLSGYWREGRLHPALNNAGWYPTGDRVSRDEQGEYRFHGRLGRMLKCSGYRIEPAEIEAVLHRLPGMVACAVVGLDDPAAGQRPATALTLAAPLTLDAVRKHLRALLPSYMQPCRYLLLDALPRLTNGKVDYLKVCTLLESAQ
jgi:amino acid adenylation domain-containing protein